MSTSNVEDVKKVITLYREGKFKQGSSQLFMKLIFHRCGFDEDMTKALKQAAHEIPKLKDDLICHKHTIGRYMDRDLRNPRIKRAYDLIVSLEHTKPLTFYQTVMSVVGKFILNISNWFKNNNKNNAHQEQLTTTQGCFFSWGRSLFSSKQNTSEPTYKRSLIHR